MSLESDYLQQVTNPEDIHNGKLVTKIKDILIAPGWKRPERLERWSNGNPRGAEKKSPNYKEKRLKEMMRRMAAYGLSIQGILTCCF